MKKKEKGHLTSEERDIITILLTENHSIRTIVKILGRSPSTISRELKRSNAGILSGQIYRLSNTYQCKSRLVKNTLRNKIK